jgi:Uri superfamily endonuclease
MKALPGSYVLVLQNALTGSLQIGRRGHIEIQPGYYLYVGSAFGPGGVGARVSRHWTGSTAKHWHIDYLRDATTPIAAWFSHNPSCLEHEWAQAMSGLSCVTPITGFGCSDCKCDSHLFYSKTDPAFDKFTNRLKGEIELWTGDRQA